MQTAGAGVLGVDCNRVQTSKRREPPDSSNARKLNVGNAPGEQTVRTVQRHARYAPQQRG